MLYLELKPIGGACAVEATVAHVQGVGILWRQTAEPGLA